MQIVSLRLKNIKSHREAEFSFAPGINVLAGPNGAGKSTVFEAIGYALFGVDPRDIVGRADRFISLGAKRGEVAVIFRDQAGEVWRVTRTVGANARWLLAQQRGDSFETEEHARAEETEQRLRQILGLDRTRPLAEQFRQVIGPLQSDFLGPFVLRGAKRQEAFDRILGIDGWRRTFEGTLELQKGVAHRIACLQAEIAGRSEQLSLLPVRRAELKEVRRQQKEKETERRTLDRELADVQSRLALLDQQSRGLEAAQGDVRVLAERIGKGGAMVEQAQRQLVEAQTARTIVETTLPARQAWDRAEARVKELRLQDRQRQEEERDAREKEKLRDRLAQQLQHEEGEIIAADGQLAAEEALLLARLAEAAAEPAAVALAGRLPERRRRLEGERSELALLLGRRESLREGQDHLTAGNCPFLGESCGNLAATGIPFDDRLGELDRRVAGLQAGVAALAAEIAEAEEAEKQLAALAVRRQELLRAQEGLAERRRAQEERRQRCDRLRGELAPAAQVAAQLRENLTRFAGLEKAIAATEAERDRQQAERDRHQAHLAVAGELAARTQTLEKYAALLQGLQREKETRETELQQLQSAYDPAVHQGARQSRDDLLGRSAAVRQQLVELDRQGERLEEEIATLQRIEAEVATRRAEIGRRQEQEQLVKFLRAQVFNQVSARLSERFREEISRRADRLYRTIAETDEELVWGEGYQVVLRDLADGQLRERSDDQLSGGQTMSAVVALRLALLQTIGARLAFFDEPTSNLDAERRENLARAFRAIDLGREEVTRHWYDQLFLISHDTAFAEITNQLIEL